jgi:uncharacterized membrane protein HdeD (DUF308 family)
MTGIRRVFEILIGGAAVAIGVLLIHYPKQGLMAAVGLLSITMTVRGAGAMVYYARMARHMVGGRRLLYRGMLFLDLGILTSTVGRYSTVVIIMYLAGLHIFYGAVGLLKGREALRMKSPVWKAEIATGAASIFIAVLTLIAGFIVKSSALLVYIYAAGLIYAGLVRIISSFRKTAIVYIQ